MRSVWDFLRPLANEYAQAKIQVDALYDKPWTTSEDEDKWMDAYIKETDARDHLLEAVLVSLAADDTDIQDAIKELKGTL